MNQQSIMSRADSHACYLVGDPGPVSCEIANLKNRQLPNPISFVSPGKRGLSLFLVMCSWTCSRFWHLAEKVASIRDWFDKNDITVRLVGYGDYVEPARRFAATIGIPFKVMTDDHHMLKLFFGIHCYSGSIHMNPVVIMDQKGRVCLWRDIKGDSVSSYVEGVKKAIECHNFV